MEEREDNLHLRPIQSLTAICADAIVQNCAKMNNKDSIAWLTSLNLANHVCEILKCSLVKFSGGTFWKNKNRQFLVHTLPVQGSIRGLALSSNPDYIIIKLPHDKRAILDLKKGTLVNRYTSNYALILQSALDSTNILSNNGFIEALSPDKSFKVINQPYINPDRPFQKKYKTIVQNTRTHETIHTLQSYWLPNINWLEEAQNECLDSLCITPKSDFIIASYTTSAELKTRDHVYTRIVGDIVIWDSRSGKYVHNLSMENPFCKCDLNAKLLISSLALSNDGTFIAVGFNSGNCDNMCCKEDKDCPKSIIGIFDIKTGKQLHTFSPSLKISEDRIKSLAISADNQHIIVGYNTGLIKIITLNVSQIDLIEIVKEITHKNSKLECIIN